MSKQISKQLPKMNAVFLPTMPFKCLRKKKLIATKRLKDISFIDIIKISLLKNKC